MFSKLTPLALNKQQLFSQTTQWAQRNWMKMFSLILCTYVLLNKDLNLQLNLNQSLQPISYEAAASPMATSGDNYSIPKIATAAVANVPEVFSKENRNSSEVHAHSVTPKSESTEKVKPIKDDNLANTYSNMTYTFDKSFLKKEKKKDWKDKRKKQEAYVNRFSKIAIAEMEKFGIPASITLAQGLIETNAGDSRLARKNNNHFGMKCFSKKCVKGHCSNFTDDSHKDFFRKYKSSWESYRAHSELLMGKRYRHLKNLGKENYKGWAKGLKKAGYATDPRYAEKLINIIDELKLHRFDNE